MARKVTIAVEWSRIQAAEAMRATLPGSPEENGIMHMPGSECKHTYMHPGYYNDGSCLVH